MPKKIQKPINKKIAKKSANTNAAEDKIKKTLDYIRPSLQADGGDVKFIEFDKKNGVVKVTLIGMCSHCPMAQITLKQGIETEVKKQVPEVKEVISI